MRSYVHAHEDSTIVFRWQDKKSAIEIRKDATLGGTQTTLSEVHVPMDTGVRQAIARNVKTLRKAAGLTQGQLARKSGAAQTVISYVEKPDGKSPSVDTLEGIAQALKVPAWALMMDLKDVNPIILARAGVVISGYLSVQEEGRQQIERAVTAESRYAEIATERAHLPN